MSSRPSSFNRRSCANASELAGNDEDHAGKSVTYDLLSWPEYELLIELQKVKPVLRQPCLVVDRLQEAANYRNDLGKDLLVRVIIWCLLQDGLKQQRITRQTRGGLRKIAVELQFPRLRPSFRFL